MKTIIKRFIAVSVAACAICCSISVDAACSMQGEDKVKIELTTGQVLAAKMRLKRQRGKEARVVLVLRQIRELKQLLGKSCKSQITVRVKMSDTKNKYVIVPKDKLVR